MPGPTHKGFSIGGLGQTETAIAGKRRDSIVLGPGAVIGCKESKDEQTGV
jgi:hypothetical protein